MHRQFRQLLPEAQGESGFVISVFVDIRGFSAFSQATESPDTAMYIKRVYQRLIDEYFPFASFYKPTGDGLLLIVPYSESSLAETSMKTLTGALNCHEQFSTLCTDDQ